MYTDDFVRKNVYSYNDKGLATDTTVLVASTENYTIPFDSLDNEIFSRIKIIIEKKTDLVYEMKWTEYKGYNREK